MFFEFQFRVWFKKLVIFFKVIEEIEIISLCNLIDKISSIEENYFEKSFLVYVTLFSQDEFFKLQSLIDSDSMIYILIHTKLVDQICQKLEIQLIWLVKKKLIREYDKKLMKKIIIHKILLNLTVKSHKKLTVSILIADINHHDVILEKFWMNKNEILLDMQNDVIIFSNQLKALISVFWCQSELYTQNDHDHQILLSVQLSKCFNNSFLLLWKRTFLCSVWKLHLFMHWLNDQRRIASRFSLCQSKILIEK